MNNANASVTEDPQFDWFVDDRGMIHGGEGTPIFLEAKATHNARIFYDEVEVGVTKALAEIKYPTTYEKVRKSVVSFARDMVTALKSIFS